MKKFYALSANIYRKPSTETLSFTTKQTKQNRGTIIYIKLGKSKKCFSQKFELHLSLSKISTENIICNVKEAVTRLDGIVSNKICLRNI